MKLLFVPVLLLSATAVDCSGATPWLSTIYATANTQVVYEHNLYYNAWYASASDLPGANANGAWKAMGACDAGTEQSGEVDCSGTPAWMAQAYTNPTPVTHEGVRYINQYYATINDVPGKSAAWLAQTHCATSSGSASPTSPAMQPTVAPVTHPAVVSTVARTQAVIPPVTPPHSVVTQPAVVPTVAPATRPPATGDGVDCTGVYKWSPDATYAAAGTRVHFQHRLYQNKWWVQGTIPPQDQAWTNLGACIAGTDSLAYAPGVGLSTENEQLLCSCCKLCAKASGSTPVCLDESATEETCYYTWCPTYNTFNEAQCEIVKEQGKLGWYSGEMTEGKAVPDRAFMPYVDVTLAKVANFTQIMQTYGTNHFILAFVVSGSNCQGSWGGAYDVGSGPMLSGDVPMYAEINRLRKSGGDVVVSFGGATGTELADSASCQSGDPVANLKKAYSAVLEILKLKVLDFDIEGPAVDLGKRSTGWKYRFEAVKQLSAERPDLQLWWTLPVLPSGLIESGMAFINDLMAAGVRLDRLNLMTMNFGAATCPSQYTQGDCEVQALTSVAKQVYDTAVKLGVTVSYGFNSAEDVYPHLGSTPMIGVNNVVTEIYTLDDARKSLAIWESAKPLGLVSMWSLARDSPCAAVSADPSCSGGSVQTKDYEFTSVFSGYPNN